MKFILPKSFFIYFPLIILVTLSCQKASVWQGQGPIQVVETETKPVQLQLKQTFELGDGIFVSNAFEGARMNGAAMVNDTLLSVLISPENTPINPSSWYAFKVWAEEKQKLTLQLTYSNGSFHRYYPKISKNGRDYKDLDSIYYNPVFQASKEENPRAIAANLKIDLGPDTLWVAAQELQGTKHVEEWKDKMLAHAFVTKTQIGSSHEGRALEVLKIGEADDSKMLMLMSFQHPPELSGYLAMRAFVEVLCSNSELATNFRKNFNTYLLPIANPDGVANGHWRHNRGGVDINRDWSDFNQPEPRAIRDFMNKKIADTGGKFYVGIDFHSTWEDIYYTINPELNGNMPGIIMEMINDSKVSLPGYDPNIRPSPGMEAGVTSSSYFFFEHGAEALTYEVGDHTPRDFIQKKAEASAESLMKAMLERE